MTKVKVITEISAPPLVLIPCFNVALDLKACSNVTEQDVLSYLRVRIPFKRILFRINNYCSLVLFK